MWSSREDLLCELRNDGRVHVLLALCCSYPSCKREVIRARDDLMDLLPSYAKFTNIFLDTSIAPNVTHNVSLLFSSSSFTSVCDDIDGISAYVCPFSGASYNSHRALQYIHNRPDRRHYLRKLSERTLVCNCHRPARECWARILQQEFCKEFMVPVPDCLVCENYNESIPDVLQPERNFDVVSGGLQPTRHKLPQLIEDGCSPDEHLSRALLLEHPILGDKFSTRSVTEALDRVPEDPSRLNQSRKDVCIALQNLAAAYADEDKAILEYVHPYVRNVLCAYGVKTLAFMREVGDICGCLDDEAIIYLAIGLPLLGWAPPARGLMSRVRGPECCISDFLEKKSERNAKLIKRLGSSGDNEVDVAAFQKTMEEVKAGVLDGPYASLEATKLTHPCVVPRHGIVEMHGDAVEESIRNIDDLLAGEQNMTVGTLSAHRPTDADGLVAQTRASCERFPSYKLVAWKSDFSKAFKQIPFRPDQHDYVVVAQYSPAAGCVVFFRVFSQVFGGKSAPLNFSRYPAWLTECMVVLFCVPMTHCVDDAITIEREVTAHSGRECWMILTKLCGWKISMEKSPAPSQKFNVIRMCLDLSETPYGQPRIFVTAARLQALDKILLAILIREKLSSGEAASLSGKLGFTITGTFGKVGRAKIRPIIRRAYSGILHLSVQLYSCLVWWRRFLKCYEPRPVPTSLRDLATIVSYSDGEGGTAGVGVAVWCPWLEHPVAAFTCVPQEVRDMWGQMAGKDDYKVIFLIEAVGPLLVLDAFPNLVNDALWIHFIDNSGAEASLVGGSSSIDAGDHIVGMTWERIAKRRLWPFFDRVESAANPVDKLSRGCSAGPWRRVINVQFPTATLMRLADECRGGKISYRGRLALEG